MIVVIDYGMGNLRSVANALAKVGAGVKISSNPTDIQKAEKIVLPGVGAFGDAVFELKKRNLFGLLKKEVLAGKPFLGICLGMQLLLEKSSENPGVEGLGLIKGNVKLFPKKVKIPQIGWNQVKLTTKDQRIKTKNKCILFKGISDNSYMYFCHSYYVAAKDKDIVVAETNYAIKYASSICKNNIFAVQFHPEKSQKLGLKILGNFINATL